MYSLHAPLQRHSATQRGAILITSMLLLLVLTIIGVTVMQMSRMQERMAGNTRDLNLAFQAAEAALRAGEAYVESLDVEPIPCITGICNVWTKDILTGTVANRDAAWWVAKGQTYGQATIGGLNTAPVAVVEEIGFVRTDGDVVRGQDPEEGRSFYQITARSTGGSGLADTVVQSTYATKF